MNTKRLFISYNLVILFCLLLIVCWLLPLSLTIAASWDLESILSRYLKDNYPWEEIEVTNLQVIGDLHGDLPEKIAVEKGPLGKAIFSFVFKKNRRVTVRAYVTAFDNVVKSRRSFKRGHVISEGDIYLSKMDIRKMPHSSVRSLESVIGKSLKRSIIANIPIVETMIEKSQVVKRGKRVVLLIDHRGLNITVAGKTKEKGYVGLPVKAINLSSKKVITGILIDENTVKVEL